MQAQQAPASGDGGQGRGSDPVIAAFAAVMAAASAAKPPQQTPAAPAAAPSQGHAKAGMSAPAAGGSGSPFRSGSAQTGTRAASSPADPQASPSQNGARAASFVRAAELAATRGKTPAAFGTLAADGRIAPAAGRPAPVKGSRPEDPSPLQARGAAPMAAPAPGTAPLAGAAARGVPPATGTGSAQTAARTAGAAQAQHMAQVQQTAQTRQARRTALEPAAAGAPAPLAGADALRGGAPGTSTVRASAATSAPRVPAQPAGQPAVQVPVPASQVPAATAGVAGSALKAAQPSNRAGAPGDSSSAASIQASKAPTTAASAVPSRQAAARGRESGRATDLGPQAGTQAAQSGTPSAAAATLSAPARTVSQPPAPQAVAQQPAIPDPKPVPQPAFSVPTNSGSWTLQVAPPGLGPVHVQLELRSGALDTRFLVNNPGAKSALELGLPTLRVNLTGQGVNVGSLNVGLSHGGDQQPRQQQAFGSPYDRGGRQGMNQSLSSALSAGRSPPSGRQSALNLLG